MGFKSKLDSTRNTTLLNMHTEISEFTVISNMGSQMDSYQYLCENVKVKNYGKKNTGN